MQQGSRAAATPPLAWGRHRIWQSRGGSSLSGKTAATQGTGLLPHVLHSGWVRTASQGWLAGVGREGSVRYYSLP